MGPPRALGFGQALCPSGETCSASGSRQPLSSTQEPLQPGQLGSLLLRSRVPQHTTLRPGQPESTPSRIPVSNYCRRAGALDPPHNVTHLRSLPPLTGAHSFILLPPPKDRQTIIVTRSRRRHKQHRAAGRLGAPGAYVTPDMARPSSASGCWFGTSAGHTAKLLDRFWAAHGHRPLAPVLRRGGQPAQYQCGLCCADGCGVWAHRPCTPPPTPGGCAARHEVGNTSFAASDVNRKRALVDQRCCR